MLPQRYYKWLLYGAGILVPTGLATAYYFHTRATHKPSKITLNIFDFDGTTFLLFKLAYITKELSSNHHSQLSICIQDHCLLN